MVLQICLKIQLSIDVRRTELLTNLKSRRMQERNICFWNKWNWKYNHRQFPGSKLVSAQKVFQMTSLPRYWRLQQSAHPPRPGKTRKGRDWNPNISKPSETISSSGIKKSPPKFTCISSFQIDRPEAHPFFSFFSQVQSLLQSNSPHPNKWMKWPLSRSEILGTQLCIKSDCLIKMQTSSLYTSSLVWWACSRAQKFHISLNTPCKHASHTNTPLSSSAMYTGRKPHFDKRYRECRTKLHLFNFFNWGEHWFVPLCKFHVSIIFQLLYKLRVVTWPEV